MSFFNGLKNIKNILIISALSLLLTSIFVLNFFFEKKKISLLYHCDAQINFNLTDEEKKQFSEFEKICLSLLNYKEETNKNFNKEIRHLSIVEEADVIFFKYDLDSISFFRDFALLNNLYFSAKKFKEVNKISNNELFFSKLEFNEFASQILEISNKERVLFYSNKNFNNQSLSQQNFMVLNYLALSKIKQLDTVNYLSKVYIKLFNDNSNIYLYILFVNLLILFIVIFLFYLIINQIFPKISKQNRILILSNVFLFPLVWIYFISFYKEPYILLCLILLIYNFILLFSENINFKKIILSTILVILSLIIIIEIKYIYFAILLSSYLIGSVMLLIYKNSKSFYFLIFFQILFIIISVNSKPLERYYNFYYKLNIQVSEYFYHLKKNTINKKLKKLSDFNNVRDKEIYNQIKLKFNFESYDLQSAAKHMIDEGIDDRLIARYEEEYNLLIQNKLLNKKFNEKKKQILIVKNDNYSGLKPPISSVYFESPNKDKVIANKFKFLDCDYLISFCEKIDNFMFRLNGIKRSTLAENNFFDKDNGNLNETLINPYVHNSSFELIFKIPFATIKSLFSPYLFNLNLKTLIFTVYKLTLTFSLLVIIFIMYRNEPKKYSYILISNTMIFLPLLVSIYLTTSNYFTYFRYVYPFNVFSLIIVLSFFTNYFSKKLNV